MKFKWTKIKQYYFEEIKQIVARDNLLDYPDFNEEFKIHSNASNFQLVPVISQYVNTIPLYSIRKTGDHKRYTVTEK